MAFFSMAIAQSNKSQCWWYNVRISRSHPHSYENCDAEKNPLYPRELVQEVLLGLHSMCKGAKSKFFNGLTTIEYIRNFVKRVRKKESAVLLASQSIEDFALPGIA